MAGDLIVYTKAAVVVRLGQLALEEAAAVGLGLTLPAAVVAVLMAVPALSVPGALPVMVAMEEMAPGERVVALGLHHLLRLVPEQMVVVVVAVKAR